MNTKNILSSNAFWVLNKTLVRNLDNIQAAVFVTYLIDKEDFHRVKGTLKKADDREWFFATIEKAEEATTLTYRQQRSCVKLLIKKGLIHKKLFGIPAKTFYSLCHEQLLQNVITRYYESAKQVHQKAQNNIGQNNTTSSPESAKQVHPKAQNIIIRTDEKNRTKRTERKEQIDSILLFFKDTTKKDITISGFRAENNRNAIRSILKLKEKPTQKEIEKVIELKYYEWYWNPTMSKHVKISTIFRKSNFLKYLEELKTIESSPQERTIFINSINAEKKRHGIKTDKESEADYRRKSGVGSVDANRGF